MHRCFAVVGFWIDYTFLILRKNMGVRELCILEIERVMHRNVWICMICRRNSIRWGLELWRLWRLFIASLCICISKSYYIWYLINIYFSINYHKFIMNYFTLLVFLLSYSLNSKSLQISDNKITRLANQNNRILNIMFKRNFSRILINIRKDNIVFLQKYFLTWLQQ